MLAAPICPAHAHQIYVLWVKKMMKEVQAAEHTTCQNTMKIRM